MRSVWILVVCLSMVMFCLSDASFVSAANQLAPATSAQENDESNGTEDDDADDNEGSGEDSDEAKDDSDAEEESSDEESDDQESEKSDEADSEKKDESGSKEDKDDSEEKDEKKRDTHTVKPKRLKIEVEAEGTFVAKEMTEVELDPETWSTFEITEVVSHGSKVHKGEVLVKFDGEKLKKAIDDLELDQKLNELAIRKAEQELPRLEESIKDAYEQAERSLEEARDDYEHYKETDRDILIKSVNMSLKSAEQRTENAREELRQLEKMYEADDLTEETEEIILKRQRAEVEQAEFYLERAKLSHERNLNVYLPRRDIQEKESLERAERAYERAKTALETDITRAKYELEKARRARTESLERHSDLTSDLGLLEIKAPADGIVYYGEFESGSWANTASLIEKLKPENNAPTGSTLMTIVQPRPLYVASQIKEADRPDVEKGQSVTVQPTGSDSLKLDATVSELSAIPVAQGKFSLEVDLAGDDQPEWLVAGMTGKVKITTYEKKDAILVPKKAVHSEEGDEDAKYVWLVDGEDVEKRAVKTGKTKGESIEIVEGLKEGDVVSLEDESKKSKDD